MPKGYRFGIVGADQMDREDRMDREEPSSAPVTKLRGAGVDVDPRRAGWAVAGVCLVAVIATAVVLFVAGVNKNSQATNLQQHGVPVAVTVTGCQGLLGGSGSNAAGYACTGVYHYGGQHFTKTIPGIAFFRTGSVVRGVVVPSDPGLLSTPQAVANQRASWKVFIAPAVLLLVALVGIAIMFRIARRNRPRVEDNR
jgi:hypothetical protein